MTVTPAWWRKPRRIAVVCDNDEWMRGASEGLVAALRQHGDDAYFCDSYAAVGEGAVAVFLSCHGIATADVLARNRRNLVVHAGDLPRERGWSPLTWRILSGRNTVPVCLIEAAPDVDSGAVYYRSELGFGGHELLDDLRAALAAECIALVRRFLDETAPPVGVPQDGEPTWLPRRSATDSELDPERSIASQFDLLRVCDNDRYPAFFHLRGHTYRLRIDRVSPDDDRHEQR